MSGVADEVAGRAQRAFAAGDWSAVDDALRPYAPALDAHLRLVWVEARRRLGDDGSALRPEVRRAVIDAGPDADRLVRAAHILARLGDPVGAEAVAARAVRAAPTHHDARLAHAETLSHLGREREAVLTLEDGLDPAISPSRALAAARLRRDHWDGAGARSVAEAVLAQHPGDATAWTLAIDGAVVAGDPDAAARVTAAVPHVAPHDLLLRALDAGALEEARGIAETLPPGLRAAWRARWALWDGRLDDARTAATEGDAVPLAAMVLAACDVVDGHPDPAVWEGLVAASSRVDPLAGDPIAARLWEGEAWRLVGRPDRARVAAQDAVARHGRHLLRAQLLTLVADDASPVSSSVQADPQAVVDAHALPHAAVWSGPAEQPRGEARALHAVLGLDRSRWPTARGPDGRAVRVHVPEAPLHRLRPLQESALVRDPAEVQADFAALARAWPDDPTVLTWAAELDLWLGAYEDALAKVEEALRRCRTQKWAWAGLGAARLFLGDPAGALAAFEEGRRTTGGDGPSAAAYRGEAHWRLGRLDDAARDLVEALRAKPGRVSAWLLWARVRAAQGHPDDASRVWDRLRATSPGTVADVRVRTGHDASPVEPIEVLLSQMQGNRSSTLPTTRIDRVLRLVTWVPPASRPRMG